METNEEEFQVCKDVLEYISTFLKKENDIAGLARVNSAWRHALDKQNNEIWKKEWEKFKAEHGHEKWFTEQIYDVPWKSSRLSMIFDLFKNTNDHQSLRQKWFSNLQRIENPSYVELLLYNSEKHLQSMSVQQSKNFLKKLQKDRPKIRHFIGKLAALSIGVPFLVALGIAVSPLGVFMIPKLIKKKVDTGHFRSQPRSGYASMAGGLGSAVEERWPIIPSFLSFYGAGKLLLYVKEPYAIESFKQMYKDTKEYLKEKQELDEKSH